MKIAKKLLGLVIEVLEDLAADTETKIDDYAVGLVKELYNKYFSD